jgi:transposase
VHGAEGAKPRRQKSTQPGEPLWFGRDRKQETLDAFLSQELSQFQRLRVQAVCVDMWPAFTNSIQHWPPDARIVYDMFHIMQHANQAVDEVRRAEFFRKGGRMRGIVKGKRWLLLTRWVNLESRKRQELNGLFALNRRVAVSEESGRLRFASQAPLGRA